MLGLRFKILIGFGGLLLILVTVSALGTVVFERYARTNQRVLRDDLSSVTAANDLQGGLQTIDRLLFEARDGRVLTEDEILPAERRVDAALREQSQGVTIPAERDATGKLEQRWTRYKASMQLFIAETSPDVRREMFHSDLGPSAQLLRETIDQIYRMNADDIRLAHDEAAAVARKSAWAMSVLTLCGAAGAVIFALAIGKMILRPVANLTMVVRQIERGNLDPPVAPAARDELGTLAVALQRMAGELRALKRIDHERLIRTQRTTQLAIDSMPDAVIVVSPDGRVEITNNIAKRLFELEPGIDVAAHADRRWADLHQRVRATGQQQQGSSYASTIRAEVNNDTRFFMPSAMPILDESRNVIGTTIVLSDVTQLRRLDEMKDDLLSLVSHELKTPLTSMRMILPLLLEERIDRLTPRQRELIDAVRADAVRLHQIVENLLDLGRIAAGRVVMDLRPMDPRKLVRIAVERMRSSFSEREVEIRADLPDARLPLVLAGATRIGHVLINLLDNAQRYSRRGGIVDVTLRELDDFVEFSVTDRGAGIPRQHLPRIFEKFFRVPGQSGDGGSGLGLAIVKDIVEAHGGGIVAESVEGRGSTFRFTLRRADQQHALTTEVHHDHNDAATESH